MKRSSILLSAAATATAAALAALPAVPAGAATVSDPLTTGLVGPLQLDVHRGSVYVSQTFIGTITKIRGDGTTRDLVKEPGGVTGLSVADDGSITYTFSGAAEDGPVTQLKRYRPGHGTRVIADLGAYEAEANPDRSKTYGFLDLSARCAAKVGPGDPETGAPGGQPYKGLVDSNPYAVADAPGGGWYVADAGGNDILKVGRGGQIRPVYVARPQRHTVTADQAAALELPRCTVGHTFAFEPVPTDVEVSRSGKLYVSLLPGGPESDVLGARGKVIRINPMTGASKLIAGGLLSATNVALASHHRLLVTELFGNKIDVLDRRTGAVRSTVQVPTPSAVEFRRGAAYAAVDVLNEDTGGSVVRITG